MPVAVPSFSFSFSPALSLSAGEVLPPSHHLPHFPSPRSVVRSARCVLCCGTPFGFFFLHQTTKTVDSNRKEYCTPFSSAPLHPPFQCCLERRAPRTVGRRREARLFFSPLWLRKHPRRKNNIEIRGARGRLVSRGAIFFPVPAASPAGGKSLR